MINALQPTDSLALAEIDARVEVTLSVIDWSDATVLATMARVTASFGHAPIFPTPAFTIEVDVSFLMMTWISRGISLGILEYLRDTPAARRFLAMRPASSLSVA